MTTRPLSRQDVREIDRRAVEEFGLAIVVLMENAGAGVARRLIESGVEGPVVVCCGKGNNGGDGFVIARHLESHGLDVRVLLAGSPAVVTGAARTNLDVLEKAGVPIDAVDEGIAAEAVARLLDAAGSIIDALLGIGARGPMRPPFRAIVEAINANPATVVAVDLPSGLDCDTGQPADPTVQADRTFTMVGPKIGFDVHEAAEFLGDVEVIDIGVPRRLLAEFERR